MNLAALLARVVWIALVTVGSYAAMNAVGKPGWAPVLAVSVILIVHFVRVIRDRRGLDARADRWVESQTASTNHRRQAIEEIRRVLARGQRTGESRDTQAKLSILLSELLAAEGELGQAAAVLDAIDDETLAPGERAGTAYARALLLLRAGEAERARSILVRLPRHGLEPAVGLRLELLEAAAELEVGDPEAALETANTVRKRAGKDESLEAEARIVRAAALDALGRRDEAMEIIRALGDDVRATIAVVGLPRARSLVDAVEAPFRGTA